MFRSIRQFSCREISKTSDKKKIFPKLFPKWRAMMKISDDLPVGMMPPWTVERSLVSGRSEPRSYCAGASTLQESETGRIDWELKRGESTTSSKGANRLEIERSGSNKSWNGLESTKSWERMDWELNGANRLRAKTERIDEELKWGECTTSWNGAKRLRLETERTRRRFPKTADSKLHE